MIGLIRIKCRNSFSGSYKKGSRCRCFVDMSDEIPKKPCFDTRDIAGEIKLELWFNAGELIWFAQNPKTRYRFYVGMS